MRVQIFENLRRRLLIGLAHRLPPCEEITPLISAAMEKSLSLRQCVLIKLHLFTCGLCRRYKLQLHFMRDTAQIHGRDTQAENSLLRQTLTSEARERMKRALQVPSSQ